MSKETGTLNELNVKPGDVVECLEDYHGNYTNGKRYTITVSGKTIQDDGGEVNGLRSKFRIISRASDDTPKLWRDMSDEKKGALLLAHHEGKVIEEFGLNQWGICAPVEFLFNRAYRVKPEPVRETVTSYWCPKWGMRLGNPVHDTTHRITFDLIDGKPYCEKCPTCGTARSVDMEEL